MVKMIFRYAMALRIFLVGMLKDGVRLRSFSCGRGVVTSLPEAKSLWFTTSLLSPHVCKWTEVCAHFWASHA